MNFHAVTINVLPLAREVRNSKITPKPTELIEMLANPWRPEDPPCRLTRTISGRHSARIGQKFVLNARYPFPNRTSSILLKSHIEPAINILSASYMPSLYDHNRRPAHRALIPGLCKVQALFVEAKLHRCYHTADGSLLGSRPSLRLCPVIRLPQSTTVAM